MKRPAEIAKEERDMLTIVNLTSAFEGLAGMHISRIKDQTLQAQKFFAELWKIYTQLRVDSLFRFGREDSKNVLDKELYIAITAEGGFSGDIDQKLINWMLETYSPEKHDIIIIGHHGAVQLTQAGAQFKKYYKLPVKDDSINVSQLLRHVSDYKSTTLYYQTYVSLMVQDVKRVELQKSVQEAGSRVPGRAEDIIDEQSYIFEPSSFAVVAHLERSMLEITLSQAILESKLAQYASRFRSMGAAKEKSIESRKDLRIEYNRTKRSVADERLKETINSMRVAIRV